MQNEEKQKKFLYQYLRKGVQTAHAAPVCCHFKMPLLPDSTNRFHNPLRHHKDKALSLRR